MRRLVALLLLLGLVVTACSGDDDDDAPDDGDATPTSATTGAPILGGRLVVGLETAISGLDPAATMTVSELTAAYGVFDPLLAVDDDGAVTPYLAASFEGSDDDTHWTIGLREGITFSDGTPLDAAAVVAMFDRLLASPITQPSLRLLRGVRAVGPMAVELATDPWPEVGEVLAGPIGLVPSPTMVDARHPVGTGPFTVGEITSGQPVVLARRDAYWRADDLPSLNEVELRGVPDQADRIAALARGDLEVVHVSGDDAIEALRDTDGVVVGATDDTQRALVVYAAEHVACITDDEACDVEVTVETDQPDDVVDPVVEAWEDDGIDVTVDRVDQASLQADLLVGSVEAVLTVDDGLPRGRIDGDVIHRRVIETIPWAYGSTAKVGGVLDTTAVPGVLHLAALYRTR